MSLLINIAELIFDSVFSVVASNDAVQSNPDAMAALRMVGISFSIAMFVFGLPLLWILKNKR